MDREEPKWPREAIKIAISSPTSFHLFDLSRELARKGHDVSVFSAGLQSQLPTEVRHKSTCAPWLGSLVKVSRLVARSDLRRTIDWQLITRFDRWVARQITRQDVVVALSGRGLATLRRAGELGALPVCDRGSTHIQHQDEILGEEFATWGIPYGGIDPRGVQRELAEYETAKLITVPSSYCAQTFLDRGIPPDKVVVVPYGVDAALFQPGRNQRIQGGFRLLFVGQLTLRKGLPYLLAAARRLSRTIPGFELWLVGDPDPELRRMLAEDPAPWTLLGRVSRRRLAQLYQQATAFILPSIEEGLPTVLMQAMATGLPIVATINSGAGDLIEDGLQGFLIPARSSELIEERILSLHRDEGSRAAIGDAARTRVLELGGWAAYADRALAAYSGAGHF